MLQKLALDNAAEIICASQDAQQSLYMDDLLVTVDIREEALQSKKIQQECLQKVASSSLIGQQVSKQKLKNRRR